MRRILALSCALLAIAGASCTKPNNPNAGPANPPAVSDNNNSGGSGGY